MVSTLQSAFGSYTGFKRATYFAGQVESLPAKPKSSSVSPAEVPNDRFEKLARQVDEIHEAQEMFFDAFHELDVRTSKMMDDQTEMLQLLRQLVSNHDCPQQSATPSSSPHRRKLNIPL